MNMGSTFFRWACKSFDASATRVSRRVGWGVLCLTALLLPGGGHAAAGERYVFDVVLDWRMQTLDEEVRPAYYADTAATLRLVGTVTYGPLDDAQPGGGGGDDVVRGGDGDGWADGWGGGSVQAAAGPAARPVDFQSSLHPGGVFAAPPAEAAAAEGGAVEPPTPGSTGQPDPGPLRPDAGQHRRTRSDIDPGTYPDPNPDLDPDADRRRRGGRRRRSRWRRGRRTGDVSLVADRVHRGAGQGRGKGRPTMGDHRLRRRGCGGGGGVGREGPRRSVRGCARRRRGGGRC